MTEFNISNLIDDEMIKRFKALVFEYDDLKFANDTISAQEIDTNMTMYISHPFKWNRPLAVNYSIQGESPASTPIEFSSVCNKNLEFKTIRPHGLITFNDGCKKIKIDGCSFPKDKDLILDFAGMQVKPDIEISETEIENLVINGAKSVVLTKIDIVNEGKLTIKDCPNINVVSVTGDDAATCSMAIDNSSAVVITYAGVSFNTVNGGIVKSIKDITIPLEREALEGENVFVITTPSSIIVPVGTTLAEPTASNTLNNTIATSSSGGSGSPETQIQKYTDYPWLIEIDNIHKGKIVRYTCTRLTDGLKKYRLKYTP